MCSPVILPDYFSSEWSFAQFRLPETTTYVTAFGEQQNTVMIIGMDGRYGQTYNLFIERTKNVTKLSLNCLI
jgi:hypothetical protein